MTPDATAADSAPPRPFALRARGLGESNSGEK